MTLFVDDRIYRLQLHGGISTIWNNLLPHLQAALQTTAFDSNKHDVFMSTYYAKAPDTMDSVVLVYDFIAERYPQIGSYHIDAVQKREAIRDAKAIIAISQWVAQDVQTICHKPATVAYCGTAIQRANPDSIAAFKKKYTIQRPYVLMSGRRGLYKNAQTVYQAWPFFAAHHDMMVLCIGANEQSLADQQFQEQYPKQWRSLVIDPDEMAAAITGAEMLVYPSYYEGFGLPVLEAMACGVAVICGLDGAVSEFAQDSPYYCDVYRPVSIAHAMNKALQADYERKAKAMQRAQAFTWERMAQEIIQVIKELPND